MIGPFSKQTAEYHSPGASNFDSDETYCTSTVEQAGLFIPGLDATTTVVGGGWVVNSWMIFSLSLRERLISEFSLFASVGGKAKYLIGVILDPVLAVFKFCFHEIFASTTIIN